MLSYLNRSSTSTTRPVKLVKPMPSSNLISNTARASYSTWWEATLLKTRSSSIWLAQFMSKTRCSAKFWTEFSRSKSQLQTAELAFKTLFSPLQVQIDKLLKRAIQKMSLELTTKLGAMTQSCSSRVDFSTTSSETYQRSFTDSKLKTKTLPLTSSWSPSVQLHSRPSWPS